MEIEWETNPQWGYERTGLTTSENEHIAVGKMKTIYSLGITDDFGDFVVITLTATEREWLREALK